MKPKSQKSKMKETTAVIADTLQRGGRASEDDLSEIASVSVVDLLKSGLTLEQAETVFKMAAIEAARMAGENAFVSKVPEMKVSVKKGKK